MPLDGLVPWEVVCMNGGDFLCTESRVSLLYRSQHVVCITGDFSCSESSYREDSEHRRLCV